jgi:FKBP-type peptidyl-prolyl cis-trans isomerase SlyD
MPIEDNKVVTINYTLKDNEGNVIQTTENQAPFSFISGRGQILPGLEKEINTMLIGGTKEVELAPEDAYGERMEEAVKVVDPSFFPKDKELKVGMGFTSVTPDGRQLPFFIRNIEGDEITIDFNHPLAGTTLNFEVELVDIRDATPEEQQHNHVH